MGTLIHPSNYDSMKLNSEEKEKDLLEPCLSSILKKPVNGHWCFNCYHFVDIDDIYVNKGHREYLFDKLESIISPRDDFLVCICLDCVFYRTQKCASCIKGLPLCMYSLSEWFEHMPRDRMCIDCTAIKETKDILKQLNNLCASQCILQCNSCCEYKYVSSFSAFENAYGNEARKIVCNFNMKKDFQLYKRMICLFCRLNEETKNYCKNLKDRYFSKISIEPVLTKDLNNIPTNITANAIQGGKFYGSVSYAKAVSGPSLPIKQHYVDLKSVLQRNNNDKTLGPVYFLSTMQDYVSEILLKVLQVEIISLQSKTELELKLSELPSNIWYEILQKKMQFTTHMFSLQASGLSNFSDPESRWAYTAVYTPVHASMVYDIVLQGRLISLIDAILEANNSQQELLVCCFGCGPGSEVLGLNPFLPKHTKYHLFDSCAFWEHNAKSLLKNGMDIDFEFHHCDAQKKLRNKQMDIVKKAKLFTFVKFISAIQNQLSAVKTFQALFQNAPKGSRFLIIDNSQPQIKHFVENLVFPNGKYNETESFKENDEYRMFTTYAEYRFDVTEMMSSHEEICKLLSLVMEWVERPPLVDIRIYVFLIEKK